MDIDPQRKTWSNFIKLTTYTTVTIVIILALMAIIYIKDLLLRLLQKIRSIYH